MSKQQSARMTLGLLSATRAAAMKSHSRFFVALSKTVSCQAQAQG